MSVRSHFWLLFLPSFCRHHSRYTPCETSIKTAPVSILFVLACLESRSSCPSSLDQHLFWIVFRVTWNGCAFHYHSECIKRIRKKKRVSNSLSLSLFPPLPPAAVFLLSLLILVYPFGLRRGSIHRSDCDTFLFLFSSSLSATSFVCLSPFRTQRETSFVHYLKQLICLRKRKRKFD